MERTLVVLNDLVAAGVVERYAIGGAVAEIYWGEPVDTSDLDVFVLVPPTAHPLMPLEDVYRHLKERGHVPEQEFVRIEGLPVQFLLADSPSGLAKEALNRAEQVPYGEGGVLFSVVTPEYLIALALELGRSKDYLRVSRLLEYARRPPDLDAIRDIVARYHLGEKWQRFVARFPEYETLL